MLAVLPFEVLDADSSASPVSAGLTEELTFRLANLEPERLGVIARTSAAKFSRTAVAEIGKNLGVDYVVSGAVRSGTDRMRITVQLLRTSDESHLWADAFDRSLADVLDTQRDIAHRVSNALSLQLASAVPVHGDAPVSAARMPTLEARWLLDGGVTEKRSRARVLLDSAIAVDSTYAPAWSSLARLHVSGSGGVGSARLARAAAERAVTLERNNIESRLILANLRYQNDWDWDGAASDFERALSIATGQASVHHAYALFLAARGETAKARRHIEVAMRLDPVSTLVIGDAAWVHYHTHDFDEAERLAERVLSLDEHNLAALSTLANIAAVRGDRASSVDYGIRLAGAIRASGGQTGTTAAKADFEQFWNSWIAWWRSNSRGSLQAYQVAVGFSHLEQSDSAIASLEKGAQPGEGGMTTIAVDPAFDRLRGDARFRAVAARIAPAGLH
jgi:TolB-like protein/tetratricopeptide (TPR) repeat protein